MLMPVNNIKNKVPHPLPFGAGSDRGEFGLGLPVPFWPVALAALVSAVFSKGLARVDCSRRDHGALGPFGTSRVSDLESKDMLAGQFNGIWGCAQPTNDSRATLTRGMAIRSQHERRGFLAAS